MLNYKLYQESPFELLSLEAPGRVKVERNLVLPTHVNLVSLLEHVGGREVRGGQGGGGFLDLNKEPHLIH